MFIEIAELLKCPEEHEETFLVLATGAMKGRAIRYGTLGCPTCKREFFIVQEIAKFGEPPGLPAPTAGMPDAEVVHALLGLASPGGYVVLLGSAAMLADDLAGRIGVHFICVNAPGDLAPATSRSLLEATDGLPLRPGVVRGVVVGGEYGSAPWMAEAARVTLHGQRVVGLTETIQPPEELERLAVGQGAWVGRKR
jgi:hypothetical protein